MEEPNALLAPSPSIPKSLLEKHTGCQVLTHLIESGSKPGDNYMGVVYSVTAEVIPPNGDKERRHYIIKCYPSHPSRQTYLSKTNLFHRELQFYTVLVNELHSFQKHILENYDEEKFTLAFPECQGGETINYDERPEEIPKVCNPLDNFVMMTDLKKTFGCEMRDKQVGFDFDHMRLAVKELATFHALSWAYKKHKEVEFLERFPFLKSPFTEEDGVMWGRVIDNNIDIAAKTLDSALGEGNKLSEGTRNYKAKTEKLIALFMNRAEEENGEKDLWKAHRDPPKEFVKAAEVEEPWRVICHGDSWLNNMLFKYDKSGKPEKVILLDFQMSRVSCPTADLVYLMYSSSTTELRRDHLETFLQLYHDRFLEVCKKLKAEPLPGFSMESLKRRYQCSLPLGYTTAVCFLPMTTKEEKQQMKLDEADADSKLDDIFIEAFETEGSALYTEKISKVTKELYDMGVI